MVRRRNSWIFFGIFFALLVSTMFLPDVRLNAELAAARREGLWATPEQMARDQKKVPADRNAMNWALPLIEEEKAQREGMTFADFGTVLRKFLDGKATPVESEGVRGWFRRKPELAEEWREVADRPEFSSGTDWAQGCDRIWKASFLHVGEERLLVAARLGVDPQENLLAAARLGALVRREPGLISQGLSYRFMEPMLKLGKRLGIGRDLDAALGPPADLRLAYRGLMADEVAMMEEVRSADFRNRPFGPKVGLEERFRQLAPFAAAAKQRVVQHWRQIWRDLPKDSRKYVGAAAVLDREYPQIEREIYVYSHAVDALTGFHHTGPVPGAAPQAGDALRRIGELEALRARYRQTF